MALDPAGGGKGGRGLFFGGTKRSDSIGLVPVEVHTYLRHVELQNLTALSHPEQKEARKEVLEVKNQNVGEVERSGSDRQETKFLQAGKDIKREAQCNHGGGW